MQVTSCKVKIIESETARKLKGVANITIDDAIAIHDIRILEGEKGLFIAMPSKQNKNGDFKDIVHAINSETRAIFTTAILSAYEEELKNIVG